MKNKEKKMIGLNYHGKLEKEVTLDFGDESITLEKDCEFCIFIVLVDNKEASDE